jgi:hypothetical protein
VPEGAGHPALRRVLREAGDPALADKLAGLELGDGGSTDWTARLLGSRKERLLISGYGIDRIALARGT